MIKNMRYYCIFTILLACCWAALPHSFSETLKFVDIMAAGNYTVALTAQGKAYVAGDLYEKERLEAMTGIKFNSASNYSFWVTKGSGSPILIENESINSSSRNYGKLEDEIIRSHFAIIDQIARSSLYENSEWPHMTKTAEKFDLLVGIKSDGTIDYISQYPELYKELSNWQNVKDVVVSESNPSFVNGFVLGLLEDGTVKYLGNDPSIERQLSKWTNIAKLAAGRNHIVGLKTDGTLVSCGNNDFGQLNVNTWAKGLYYREIKKEEEPEISTTNYYVFYENGKRGVKNMQNKVILPAKYNEISLLENDYFVVDSMQLYGPSGKLIAKSKYGIAFYDGYDTLVVYGQYDGYRLTKLNGQTISNIRGEISGVAGKNQFYLTDSRMVLKDGLNQQLYTLKKIDAKGKVLAEVKSWEDITLPSERNSSYGIIGSDTSGYGFESQYVYKYIDKNLKTLFNNASFEEANAFHDGLALVKVNGLYGYINTKGQYVLKPQFYKANNFKEGLALVYDSKTEGFGYVNPKGQMVLPAIYKAANDFSEGLAFVRMPYDSTLTIIDKKGNVILKTNAIFSTGFEHGRAGVTLDNSDESYWLQNPLSFKANN